MALAADLGWRGIPCRLVEQTDGSITQPKMDLVGVRTMEVCRRWGIASWVENSPYPRDYPQSYIYCTSLNGFELQREPFYSKREEARPHQSPQKRERCPQDMFDPILRRFVRTFPEVQVDFETRLEHFHEDAEGVTTTLVNTRTGEREVVRSRYLAGCDGSSSTVRGILGIKMSGNPVLTYTTNAILECPNFESLHRMGRAYRFIFIGPEGTYATIVAINGRDRWRLSVVGNEQQREYSEDEIRAVAHRAMGFPFDFKILSIMPWVRRELIADSYGTDRVFLVGDSAHLLSPTGGFGMNTGIQEAVDLAWKIEGALQGWGGPALLASYEMERRPVAIRNVTEASRNLKNMLNPRKELPPKEVFEDGAAGDRARAIYGGRYAEMMRREWFTIGIHLGYVYENSPIVVPDGTLPPPDEVSTYSQTARPGSRAPHVWINHDRTESTLDLFGRGFTLLQIGPRPPNVDGFRRQAAARGLPLTVVPLNFPGAADAYQTRLALVRPDGHVAWRGDYEPEDLRKILDCVCGWGGEANAVAREAISA
ncbi:FAD-binding monooxygenase protein (plasmid) [Rhizobium gallicum]|uniref:FAD-binding monooxygenase protein n=2 Tax=Rhizobium gallicum TaxID=56730 RepID=A0A1L5NS54_9HYPH|nr:FAD-binding monooxygenase protein [Rhizobium gallicum]